jgi:hypothetical protein
MSAVDSVIVGCSCQCAASCSGKVGRAAVQAMPGRTQSPRTWGRRRGAGWRRCWPGALARQVARGALEGLQLVRDAAGAVGVAEVRHQRDLVDLRQRVQPRPGGAEALGREAQAVHARVHLQEHAVRLAASCARPACRSARRNARRATGPGASTAPGRALEHAFQQQDGAAPAQGAHALGLGQVEQREAVGAAQARRTRARCRGRRHWP